MSALVSEHPPWPHQPQLPLGSWGTKYLTVSEGYRWKKL